MEYTNFVVSTDLHCVFDLNKICANFLNVEYNPSKFSALIWRNKQIKGTCLLFSTGKMSCCGAKSYKEARTSVRQFARKLQLFGYNIELKKIEILTASGVYSLGRSVDYSILVKELDFSYEPEIFHAPSLKCGGVNFTIFKTGKIIITGIKSKSDVDNIVHPTLLNIETVC